MSIQNYVKVKEGIKFEEGKTEKIDIDNTIPFRRLMIEHRTGAFTGGGTLVPNALFEYIRIYVRGKLSHNLVGDFDDETIPYAIDLLRELNKLRNRVAEGNEIWNFVFPTPQRNHNAYVLAKFNTLENINTGGTPTAYTGVIDLSAEKSLATGVQKSIIRDSGKFVYGANTGRLDEFINPSEAGYKATNLMICIEDDGVKGFTNIDRITLRNGNVLLFDDSPNVLREINKNKYGVALSDGFALLQIGQPIRSNQLKLTLEISGSPTKIECHWLLSSIR